MPSCDDHEMDRGLRGGAAVCRAGVPGLRLRHIAFGLGYAVAEGLLQATGLNTAGFLVWLVSVVAGILVAGGALVLNVEKLVVIVATAVLGAGTILATYLYLFGGVPEAQLRQNPVRIVLQASPF